MIEDALASISEIFTPPFRAVLYKSLGLTLAILAALWLALERATVAVAAGATGWFKALIEITAGFGLFIGLFFLIAPTSMLVAGLFLDELAGHVEADIFPAGSCIASMPVGKRKWSMRSGIPLRQTE